MATAAEDGGAGGKFRKRPFRRSATPYDRPPTAFRATTGDGGSWLSKLVDPASKLITSGAHRLFASVFRKRLPAPPAVHPPPHQESTQAQRNKLHETIVSDPPGAQETKTVEGSNLGHSSDGRSIAELEQILKQKTFTRSQIDRLTGLLHARTPDVSPENTEKRHESGFFELAALQERRDRSADAPVRENGIESQRLLGFTTTPVASSKVFKEDVASPVEVAKAYMGSRPSTVSPSLLGFRSQVFNEDATLLCNSNNAAFPPKLSTMSPAPRSSFRSGLPNNGFMTPRSRGKPTIYSLAHTPYSIALTSVVHKGDKSTIDGYGGPSSSSSQSMWEQNGLSESRQVGLKRRSSVLDNDIGSVGPIRRIRQKSNLFSEKRLSLPASGARLSIQGTNAKSDAACLPLSSTWQPLLLDESDKIAKMSTNDGDYSIPGANFAFVPSHSSETAAKILQHLDKLVSSPSKEKSPELKLGSAMERSPAKLTTNMLNGPALRSVEIVGMSKSVEDNTKSEGSHNVFLPDCRNSFSHKQSRVEGNGSIKVVAPCERFASAMHGFDATVTVDDSVPTRTSESMFSTAVANSLQKKQAFQMIGHEDHLDVGDDDEIVSALVAERNKKLNASAGSNAAAAEAVRVEENHFSVSNAITNSIMNKKADLETSDTSVVTEKSTSFNLTSKTAPSTTFPVVTPKEPNASFPSFSFGSGNINSVPSITISSLSAVGECLQAASATLNPKPESSSSFATVATEPVQKVPESHRGDVKSVQNENELVNKPDNVTSFLAPSSSLPLSAVSTSTFSFGLRANKSSSSSIFSSSAPGVGGNNNNHIFNSSISAVSTTSSAVTMFTATSTATPSGPCASRDSIFSTSAAPSFSAAPISKFQSSAATLTAVAPALATSGGEAVGAVAKPMREKSLGSQTTTSNFSGTSALSSAGSSLFSTSIPSSTANNLSQGSAPFSTGNGSLVSAQASPSGSGVAASSQTRPFQFGSSASSPMFGSTSFPAGSSPFGSSSSATNMFSSGTSFGLSSSAPAAEHNSNGSTGGATTSTYVSSWQPTKSPIFGSTTPSTGFTFGSSSASAPSNNASMVFGSSTGASLGSMFSFTSAGASTSLSSLSPSQSEFRNSNSVFAFGSSTSGNGNDDQMNMEDMAEDNAQVSTPAVLSFGQPPITPPSGFTFGQKAPSGSFPFQFGSLQNQTTPLNPIPFQSSGSLDFSSGGSFTLGSGGSNKSTRKMIKVKRRK